MDPTIATVLIIVVFALVVVAAFVRYRRHSKTEINGPFGTRLSVEASDDPPPQAVGVRARGIVSEEAGVVIEESIQRGIDAENVRAKQDVRLSSTAQNPAVITPPATPATPPAAKPDAPSTVPQPNKPASEDSAPK